MQVPSCRTYSCHRKEPSELLKVLVDGRTVHSNFHRDPFRSNGGSGVPLEDFGNVFSIQDSGTNRSRFEASCRTNEVDAEDVTFFCKNGGSIFFAPLPNTVVSHKVHEGVYTLTKTADPRTAFSIGVENGDVLLPICHEGINRSQIMFVVLQSLLWKAKFAKACLLSPHGALSGADPYTSEENRSDPDEVTYLYSPVLEIEDRGEWLHRNFRTVFGQEKEKRLGVDVVEKNRLQLNFGLGSTNQKVASDRDFMHHAFDDMIYRVGSIKQSRGASNQKVIYFCFNKAASVVLKRLLEFKIHKSVESFSNICIVALPWPDDLTRAGGSDTIKAAQDATGETFSRDDISRATYLANFHEYASIIRLVAPEGTVKSTAASSPTAAVGGAGSSSGPDMTRYRPLKRLRGSLHLAILGGLTVDSLDFAADSDVGTVADLLKHKLDALLGENRYVVSVPDKCEDLFTCPDQYDKDASEYFFPLGYVIVQEMVPVRIKVMGQAPTIDASGHDIPFPTREFRYPKGMSLSDMYKEISASFPGHTIEVLNAGTAAKITATTPGFITSLGPDGVIITNIKRIISLGGRRLKTPERHRRKR